VIKIWFNKKLVRFPVCWHDILYKLVVINKKEEYEGFEKEF